MNYETEFYNAVINEMLDQTSIGFESGKSDLFKDVLDQKSKIVRYTIERETSNIKRNRIKILNSRRSIISLVGNFYNFGRHPKKIQFNN